MATELTEVQIEEIIKAGNEAKSKNKGKIPYGFNAELAKKYGRTPQSISQIISGKRRSKKSSKKKEIVPVIKKEEKIKNLVIDISKIPEDYDQLPNLSDPNKYSSFFTESEKYNIPDLVDLRIFLQDNKTDPICNKVYLRLFLNKKDSGVYKDFYYILNEMNKRKNKFT